LQDVFAFEVGVIGEDLIDALPGADLADDHAHGHSHLADAGLAAHYAGVLGDAIQRFHGCLLRRYYAQDNSIGALLAWFGCGVGVGGGGGGEGVGRLAALAEEEHDGAEGEHEAAPDEIDVDAQRLLVERGVAVGAEAEDAHDAADEQKDEAEGDADVETHRNSSGEL